MVQECSQLRVMEVFFEEPTSIHFIKEISRRIGLAHTSVRKHIAELARKNMIVKKESKPFDGYAANRDDEEFVWRKRAHNLLTLRSLANALAETLHPKLIVVFGSYARGEDVESSDVDIFIASQVRKELSLGAFEKKLSRNINIVIAKRLSALDGSIQKKIMNGIVLYGGY